MIHPIRTPYSASASRAPGVQRLGDHRVRHAHALERVRAELELRVPHPLRGEVARHAAHQVRDVLRLGQQPADRRVDVDEVREVAERVELPQLLRAAGTPRSGCRRASSSTVSTGAEPTK